MNIGVYISYSDSTEPVHYSKEGYYNVTDKICSISIQPGWSVLVFKEPNCIGMSRLCTQTTTHIQKFEIKSLFICERILSETEYSPQYFTHYEWLRSIYKQSYKSIVTITTEKNNSVYVSGGFFIKKENLNSVTNGYIVTAGHNIIDTTSILCTIFKDNEYVIRSATIKGIDYYGDIAVLYVLDINENQYCLEWGDSRKTEIGSFSCSIGYPNGIDAESITVGIVRDNKYIHTLGGVESMATDMQVYTGCSGSPILDINGKVIGIISYGIEGGINWGMSQYLLEHVVNNIIGYTTVPMNFTPGYIGITWSEVTAQFLQEKNSLQLPLKGFIIESVDINTNHNLKVDDIVCEIEHPITQEFIPLGNRNNQLSLSSITWFKNTGESITIKYYKNEDNYANLYTETIILSTFPNNQQWLAASSFFIRTMECNK